MSLFVEFEIRRCQFIARKFDTQEFTPTKNLLSKSY